MNLTERQLGRIEAAAGGLEESAKGRNNTISRLVAVIIEQLQEAEAEALPEEDFLEDLPPQPEAVPDVPDWREKGVGQVGPVGQVGQFGQKTPECIREFGRLYRLKAGPEELLRMIKQNFQMTQLELGALLGIKPTSMWRILHGKQRDLLLARMAEFFGEEGGAGTEAEEK